jgi:ABC-2 type transport system ATP-binding protein
VAQPPAVGAPSSRCGQGGAHPPVPERERLPRLGVMRCEPVVRIQALVKRYGTKTAVDGLDLVAREGVTAVLGPNGAGKTTTVETCEGYRKPDSGTVRVLGLDPVGQAAELRPRVGVMLQSGGVYSGARADEMLRHVAKLHAHPLDVDALIERLGLGGCGRTTYRRLSGGQQQRLALAMAVVGRPELVFLDEPTAGLDPQARRATWDLVRDLRADGVSVILTTHYMDEAEQLADDVAIIDAGRVIAQGTPEELCRGGAENTLRFTGRPALDVGSLLKALPADSTAVELTPGVYRVTGKVDPQLLATVTSWCAQHGVMPDRIAVERHTLEDVFLELTGKELRS